MRTLGTDVGTKSPPSLRNPPNQMIITDEDLDRQNQLIHRANLNPYPKGFTKVNVPLKKSGKWEIAQQTITAHEVFFENFRLIRSGLRKRVVPPDTYTVLYLRHAKGRTCVMSDTPAEAHEHKEFHTFAKGRVLMNGLGLGFALQAIINKPEVTDITVVEQSRDVLKLVLAHYQELAAKANKTIRFEHADAMEWKSPKGATYDAVWHDIWDSIKDANKPAMKTLRLRYAKKCGWQGCWGQEYL